MARPNLIQTHKVELSDGRKVRVREYDDGSIRFAVDEPPYALTECFLTGSQSHAIIKLVRVPLPAWIDEFLENPDTGTRRSRPQR